MKVLLLLVSASTLMFGQETRREITNAAANPADDKKDLSPSVPDVYAIHGQFQRVTICVSNTRRICLPGWKRW